MNRHPTWLLWPCLVLVAGCGAGTTDWQPLEPRPAAPEFTLPTLTGGRVRLSDYRGQVVVMEFWATWCGPCRYSTPSLEVIYRKFRDRGVTILLINQGEEASQIIRWAEKRFTAPILLDQEFRVAKQYGIQGIPRLFVIDREGRIVYDKSGYRGGLESNLTAVLNQLLEPLTKYPQGRAGPRSEPRKERGGRHTDGKKYGDDE